MAEQVPFKHVVGGSNPSGLTKRKLVAPCISNPFCVFCNYFLMFMKKDKYQRLVIKLRKEGYTYSEILNRVPVAKSTISLWLRSVGLAEKEIQRLTQKKLLAARRGGEARKIQRIEATKRIKKDAHKEISKIGEREFLMLGTMLYWAEGSKNKEYRPSQGISFSNSDPLMIKFFLNWLNECLNMTPERIKMDIYLHRDQFDRIEEIRRYWAIKTGFPEAKFGKIYAKEHKIKSKRRNVGNKYFGLVRIRVCRSTDLNRKIEGWIEGIANQCGVV